MAKEDDVQKLDADTIEHLGQVKKGHARKYVMICKGTSIVSLVVYKKGTVEKYKKQAKEQGRGQFYFGNVVGGGMEINFQLARADGFDKEPVKTPVLRTFLAETADFNCKPTFEIVDALGFVFDETDPLVKRFLTLREAALKACDTHPTAADELNSLCLEIGGHLNADESDQALPKLDRLELLLASLTGSTSQNGPTTTETNKTDTNSTEPKVNKTEQDWLAAYGKLATSVAHVLAAGKGDVSKLRAVWAYATEKAEAGDFANALKSVPALVQLIKTARESKQTAAESEIPFNVVPFVKARQKWSETRVKLREELDKLRDEIDRTLAELVKKLEEEEDDDIVVESDTDDLYDYIADLDDELETTLEKLVETPDGNLRETLKSEARNVAARYRNVLKGDFFREVDGGNGFIPVAVQSTAEAALEEIEAALA